MKILKTLLVGAALLCSASQAHAQRFVTIANDINALTNANMGNIQTNYFVPELGAGTGGLFTFDRNSTATPRWIRGIRASRRNRPNHPNAP